VDFLGFQFIRLPTQLDAASFALTSTQEEQLKFEQEISFIARQKQDEVQALLNKHEVRI
jgi:hypothetical protein